MSRIERDISASTVVVAVGALLRLRLTSLGADLEHVTPTARWLHARFDWATQSQGDLERTIRTWCLTQGVEIPEAYRLRSMSSDVASCEQM